MKHKLLMGLAASLCLTVQAQAADKIKIGFVTTLTTPAAAIGNEMMNGVNLALQHIDGKMAGVPVDLIAEDDGFRPEVGKQKTEKLVAKDNVDFITGFIWSHVLLASQKTALDAGKFLISANAGPSQLAGKLCNKNFFSVSWQNDQTPMAMGEYLNQNNVKSLYVMAPNYAAGKNMVTGLERTFKGNIVGKDLTKWGKDAQLDFSAELAKASKSGADGLYVFYPGKAGGTFLKQYQQAGLEKKLPLYTVYTIDGLSLPKLQAANITSVLGSQQTNYWSPDFDNPQNQRFVADYKKAYGKYPSQYAAQSYDAIFYIKSAVEAVGGDLKDKDKVRAALMKADFPSVRGNFKMGSNHFPIQNFYLRKVVEDSEGVWTLQTVKTVMKDHQDSYASLCKM